MAAWALSPVTEAARKCVRLALDYDELGNPIPESHGRRTSEPRKTAFEKAG